jgi:hypothetical protein
MADLEHRDLLCLSEKLKNIQADLNIFRDYMIHAPIDDLILHKLFGILSETATLCRFRLRNIAHDRLNATEDELNKIYKETPP